MDTNTTNKLHIYIGSGYTIDTCHNVCYQYKYFAIKNGDICYCNDFYSNAIYYGSSNKCLGAGLGGMATIDLYENLNG